MGPSDGLRSWGSMAQEVVQCLKQRIKDSLCPLWSPTATTCRTIARGAIVEDSTIFDDINWIGDGRQKQLLTMKTEGSGNLKAELGSRMEDAGDWLCCCRE